jgi:poly(hydroxyalkanoate) depolymerase family esterase
MGRTAEALARATQLTREGKLHEATQLIRETLGWPAAAPAHPDGSQTSSAGVIDVPARELRDAPPQASASAQPGRGASFTQHVFQHGGHRWRYRLHEPARHDTGLLPVVVMLHGCKQDSEDFARGTAMNAVAQREGFLVVYPEQLRKSNQMGCWNWFEPQHQRRGAGEPAMIAALTQQVVRGHGGDPQRVYVAGLSAGGAMAAMLGELYPDVFAAVGVHSGLPPRAAHDVPSAFQAMRKGRSASTAPVTPLPTIVFHGGADHTVAPGNGDHLVQRQLAAHLAAGTALHRREAQAEGSPGRAATRAQWVDGAGVPVLEHWSVRAGPHAWSGGQAEGSFTDPQGPDASEAMAAFFLQHRLRPRAGS